MVVAPQPSSGRIAELDALRGIAVIGIVWMNVHVFALPIQAYYNPLAWGGESPLDRLVWAASFVFVEDKFRTLFAMLFGAGCLILFDRGRAASGPGKAWRAHYARMAVLFAIGLVHAILLANNDILRAYALAGLALPLLAPLSPRALVAVAIGLMALHVGAGIVTFGGGLYDWHMGRFSSDATFFMERNFGTDPAAVSFMLERGQETLRERVVRRVEGMPGQLSAIAASLPLNLSAIALGMAFWRGGMLAGRWRTFRLQRLAAVCALVAVPALLALAWFVAESGFPGALTGAASLVLSAPFDTLLGIAYAALAMAFFTPGGFATRRLATVGRLSLTNYLMTSVILASIFASWGFGLFGTVSRAEAFAFGFVPIMAMLAWSPTWIARFGQGPLERLWRGISGLFG
ncbi:uncharacterized protein Ga0102493_111275 [Erythrobacter litoralis]|uniref:DUF418 domain-containing protein n=1 Tax=Erythrobacter litoralis TaxID=39960 RepID=UPI0005534455|nr:DUF418 domain-containing protein [Erythrobacter litoralis]AOL22304.1 uncharacterized protein Ga0102493_111275 [Erythrobacter litoralis]